MESSRTHFEVLGLKASSPQKLLCPWLENSTIFWIVKMLETARKTSQKIREDLFCFPLLEINWKKILKTFFLSGDASKSFLKIFFENTCACVLGLEHFCAWPQESLSLEGLLLALSSFFCVLGLELYVLKSTFANNGKIYNEQCIITFSYYLITDDHYKYNCFCMV